MLHGCSTGDGSGGASLAEITSKYPDFQGHIIIAPDTKFWLGVNGDYKVCDDDGRLGNWNVYKNGEIEKTIPGNQMPTGLESYYKIDWEKIAPFEYNKSNFVPH